MSSLKKGLQRVEVHLFSQLPDLRLIIKYGLRPTRFSWKWGNLLPYLEREDMLLIKIYPHLV